MKGRLINGVRTRTGKGTRTEGETRGGKYFRVEQPNRREKIHFWKKKPGEVGFNDEATRAMETAGLTKNNNNFKIECVTNENKKQTVWAYQQTVAFLLKPKTPINRMLVVHRTGSGKTFTIIQVLQNYIDDKRPKILIFPTNAVRNNFYGELMKFQNKYRDFCSKHIKKEYIDLLVRETNGEKLTPAELRTSRAGLTLVINCLEMKGKLGQRGKKGQLKSPLRAFTYSQAGGSTINKARGPDNPIFKIGYESGNAYSNKIVIMDEFHNIIKPAPHLLKYKNKLNLLQTKLKTCTNSVVVGFTATPIVDNVEDGNALIQIIKGSNTGNEEGFISYFNHTPRSLYPATEFKVCKVQMSFAETNVYVKKHLTSLFKHNKINTIADKIKSFQSIEDIVKIPNEKLIKLQNYTNSAIYASRSGSTSANEVLKVSTKLVAIAKSLADSSEKTLILIERSHGFKLLIKILNEVVKTRCGSNPNGGCWIGMYENNKESQENLKVFNSKANLRGNAMKAIVADAREFSEGVSFLGVRRLILVNPPASVALWKQRIGRALRACAHNKLPGVEQLVSVETYVATLPVVELKNIEGFKKHNYLQETFLTADEILNERIETENKELQHQMKTQFQDKSVDWKVLEPLM